MLHTLLLDYINEWYRGSDTWQEDCRVRTVLFQDLVHSRHVGGDCFRQNLVYQWNKSLPSGHPLTTVINSMYSLTLLVGCYIGLTGDYTGFWQQVYAVTYGDDNVVNPSDKVVDRFNQITVSRAMADLFGMTYTPGRKDGAPVEYMRLEEVTFLKRGFRQEVGHWVCPLELTSFLYTMYYTKNRENPWPIIADEAEKALMELSMHPPELWEKYYEPLRDILRDINVPREKVGPKLSGRAAYLEMALGCDKNY